MQEPYGADPMKGVLFGIFTAFFYSAFLIFFRYVTGVGPCRIRSVRCDRRCRFGYVCSWHTTFEYIVSRTH